MVTPHLTDAEIEELIRPPTDAEVAQALARFATEVERHYRDRLKGLYLFGSRARGDHTPESDADVAVILRDGDWVSSDEKRTLGDFAYDRLLDSGAMIQGWPVPESSWLVPESDRNPVLIRAMRRDATDLQTSP